MRPDRLIADAIRARQALGFRYAGEDRVVEPYRLTDEPGGLRLEGWQARKGWRSFHVARMEGLEPLPRHFDEPREGYARAAPGARVIAEV